MFVPLWLLGVAGLALVLLGWLALRRGSGDMIERQRRAAGPAAHRPPPALLPDEAALLALPGVREALAAGHKIEAIKLVREQTALGLKEAKDLVERLEGR